MVLPGTRRSAGFGNGVVVVLEVMRPRSALPAVWRISSGVTSRRNLGSGGRSKLLMVEAY